MTQLDRRRESGAEVSPGAMLRLAFPQAMAILALHFVWFGALLPGLWVDKGFPALLNLTNVENVRLEAFRDIAGIGKWGYLQFTLVSSVLHTAVVVLSVICAGKIKQACDHWAPALAASAGVLALLFFGAQALFVTSFQMGWTWGFDWAYYFFDREQVGSEENFGHVVAMSLGIEAATTFVIRLCSRKYHALYPAFAAKAVPKLIFAFVVNFSLFRWVLSPRIVKSMAAASGLFNGDNIAVSSQSTLQEGASLVVENLDMIEWAALAAVVHTCSMALGMTCYFLSDDVLKLACTTASRKRLHSSCVSILRFVSTFMAAAAFFHTVQMWLAYADENGFEFVEKSSYLGYFKVVLRSQKNGVVKETVAASASAVAVATGSYTIAFLIGAWSAEAPFLPSACKTRVKAFSSRNLRLRPAGKFNGSPVPDSGSLREPLLLSMTAVCLALYVADHNLLGHRVVKIMSDANNLLEQWCTAGPDAWSYLYENFTRDQLFFMTLPVLLVSEIPLWFFTLLDLLKLRCADKYRIHYSKIERKRPRHYPTGAELWKAFKVHCINFFGIYCSVFVVGVGFACKTNIIPYSFSKELPSNWLTQFLICSFSADVLFYVFHRAVHSKGLYARLHKMHHEWIYTIALAHHYMDPLEATIFMLPPILPPILLGSHITVVWAMVILTQLGGILGHSAFMIPILSNKYMKWVPFINSEYHDLHHLRFNVNYGAVWPVVDMIFGTYREEPIIYIDGIEPELKISKEQGSGNKHSAESSKKQYYEEAVPSADEVADSAEGASVEGALPELPWYMRWLPTDKSNFVVGKIEKMD